MHFKGRGFNPGLIDVETRIPQLGSSICLTFGRDFLASYIIANDSESVCKEDMQAVRQQARESLGKDKPCSTVLPFETVIPN